MLSVLYALFVVLSADVFIAIHVVRRVVAVVVWIACCGVATVSLYTDVDLHTLCWPCILLFIYFFPFSHGFIRSYRQ